VGCAVLCLCNLTGIVTSAAFKTVDNPERVILIALLDHHFMLPVMVILPHVFCYHKQMHLQHSSMFYHFFEKTSAAFN